MKFLIPCCLLMLVGCASHPEKSAVEDYLAADRSVKGAVLSPSEEKAAVGRFRDFFADVTEASVKEKTAGLYAQDAFFNDTLKTVHGSAEIEKYFLKAASHSDLIRAEVLDVARSGDNYYLRWVMDVRFKGSKKTIRTIGMTQVKFDASGRIVLHQDFWDSSAGFYEHIPVLGAGIRAIRGLL